MATPKSDKEGTGLPLRVRPSKATPTHYAASKQCSHRGGEVQVGPYVIYAGGTRHGYPDNLDEMDILVPLEPRIPWNALQSVGQGFQILTCGWKDMGPPPEGFREFLESKIIPELKLGKKILVYCIGSHGRTGTFIASLIALLEGWGNEEPDPIQKVRERHCEHAVETYVQADYVFELLDYDTPDEYEDEFRRSYRGGVSIPVLTGIKTGNGVSGPELNAWYAKLEARDAVDSHAEREDLLEQTGELDVVPEDEGLNVQGTLAEIFLDLDFEDGVEGDEEDNTPFGQS